MPQPTRYAPHRCFQQSTGGLEVLRAHYAEITEQVLERYGLRFGEGTAKATPDQLKADTPARVCDAYLYRLEAMQARPAPVAARLLQAALRD